MSDFNQYKTFKQLETNVKIVSTNTSELDSLNTLKIVYGTTDKSNTLCLNNDYFENNYSHYIYFQKNENLLIEAIRNFIRKINFDELNESLDDDLITEEKYYQELKKYPEKYQITLRNINNPDEVLYISNLVAKIGFDFIKFNTSDVSEMFSVKEEQLVSFMNYLNTKR